MNEKQQEFENLILDLLSPDNKLRIKSEENYQNFLNESPLECFWYLLSMFESKNEQVISLSLILARQIVGGTSVTKSIVELIDPKEIETIKEYLYENVLKQESLYFKKRICDIICAFYSKQGLEQSVEFLDFLKELVLNGKEENKMVLMYLIQQLSLKCSLSVAKYSKDIIQYIVSSLNSNSAQLGLYSLKACAYYLLTLNENDTLYRPLTELIPKMLQLIVCFLEKSQFESAHMCMREMIDTMVFLPKFFKPHWEQTILFFIQVAQKGISQVQIPEEIQFIATEFLVVAIEFATGLMLENENFFIEIVKICFDLISQVDPNEESEDWDDESETFSSICETGDFSLDRISTVVGGDKILPICFEIIPELLKSNRFEERFTGLRVISSIAEGSKEIFENKIIDIIEMVLPFFEDSHSRLRYQCCDTILKLLNIFPSIIQEHFHNEIITGLKQLIQENDIYTQIKVCETIVIFSEDTEPEILKQYVEELMINLVDLLQSDYIKLQEEALTAITAIAITTKSGFQKYYSELIVFLLKILKFSKESKYQLLRSKSIECISVIGSCVEKEIFQKDATEIIGILINYLEEGKKNIDESQKTYIYTALFRICEILQDSFLMFLEDILPFIIESLELDPLAIELSNLNKEQNKINLEEYNIILDTNSQKKIAIKTSLLIEKADALALIYQIPHILKDKFSMYSKDCLEIVLPLLNFQHQKKIRNYSAMSCSQLINSLLLNYKNNTENENENEIREIIHTTFKLLLESILKEKKISVKITKIQHLGQILKYCKNFIDSNIVNIYIKEIPNLLKLSLQRKNELENAEKDKETYNYEKENKRLKAIQSEIDLNFSIIETFKYLFQYHLNDMIVVFKKELFDFYIEIIDERYPVSFNEMSLCVFGDLIEFSNNIGVFQYYFEKISHFVFKYILHQNHSIRKIAAYIIGVCAKFGEIHFSSLATESLDLLIKSLKGFSDVESDESLSANDTIIASIGSILFYQKTSVDFSYYFNIWLKLLPLSFDELEVQHVSQLFCSFIENEELLFFGQNYSNLPLILSIFIQTIQIPNCKSDLKLNIINLMKNIKQNFSSEQLNEILSSMPQEIAEQIIKL
ncbi:karyopherin (importin) beta [Anaeramoeba flamelloides]|uniref:Karyopherin (Importin) beta n=1 Tax=Anaeramoeba flamelloides TaxID=1746091 RepID=A0AAV8A279_9EUKA|nr:karyopherin (importin) beta [Anaeramoeba flamelloides]